jgi:hypothetical protein
MPSFQLAQRAACICEQKAILDVSEKLTIWVKLYRKMMRLVQKIDKLQIWRGDQSGGHIPLNLCELNLQLIALPLQQRR